MKYLFVCVSILLSTTSIAQEVFFGLAGGPAKRFSSNNPNNVTSAEVLEKGMYFRLNTNGNISFTGYVLHHGNNTIITDAIVFDADYTVDYVKESLNCLEFRYGIQYNITPKRLKASHINQYVGLQVANRNSVLTDKYYIDDNGKRSNYVVREGQFEYLGGFSYTITYSPSRFQIGINTSIMVGDKDFSKWGTSYIYPGYPSSILSASLFIGYNFVY